MEHNFLLFYKLYDLWFRKEWEVVWALPPPLFLLSVRVMKRSLNQGLNHVIAYQRAKSTAAIGYLWLENSWTYINAYDQRPSTKVFGQCRTVFKQPMCLLMQFYVGSGPRDCFLLEIAWNICPSHWFRCLCVFQIKHAPDPLSYYGGKYVTVRAELIHFWCKMSRRAVTTSKYDHMVRCRHWP